MWREGREKRMSILPLNGKSMFARGLSSSLSPRVYYCLRPRFYMANPRVRLWETKKNAQNFRKKNGKSAAKMRKRCAGRGSNLRFIDFEADALPSRPRGQMILMADLQIPIPL